MIEKYFRKIVKFLRKTRLQDTNRCKVFLESNRGEGLIIQLVFMQVACGPVGHQVVSAQVAGRAKDWLLQIFLDPKCQS